MALRLAELAERLPWTGSAGHYVTAVQEATLRRRIQQLGVRVNHAAEGEPLDSLVRLVGAEAKAIFDLVRRLRPTNPESASARLRAVS